jgi:glucosamine 6-phosphate synthetase-like amidotransferase/phosphosugar isomerase protein
MRIGAIPVPGGLLRHGPMELVTLPDCAVLMLIPNDHMATTSARAVEDLLSHGARVAAVIGEGVRVPSGCRSVTVPDVAAELGPIVFGAALHMLNVSLGQALGLSEIRPKLIAKITRVE